MKSLSQMSNEKLWQLFPVVISPYCERWTEYYDSEKKLLTKSVGTDNIARISHIGSTAVPNLIAKPTIDILLEINEGTDLEALIENIEKSGYIYSEQPGRPAPHMMFMKGYTPQGFAVRVFHLHVRYSGDWDELNFKDYLIAHPDEAEKYGELKNGLKEIQA